MVRHVTTPVGIVHCAGNCGGAWGSGHRAERAGGEGKRAACSGDSHHEIARAIMKAAPAATPPMSTVCIALRHRGAPVKCPFT